MGWLFLISGLALAGGGMLLKRKFHNPLDDRPGFHPAGPPLQGLVEFAGILLLVFGLCAALVGVMTIFF